MLLLAYRGNMSEDRPQFTQMGCS